MKLDIIVQQAATDTGTLPSEWQPFDGPTTGTGAEWWYRHGASGLELYVVYDQARGPGRSTATTIDRVSDTVRQV
jgi:hypothetical protein